MISFVISYPLSLSFSLFVFVLKEKEEKKKPSCIFQKCLKMRNLTQPNPTPPLAPLVGDPSSSIQNARYSIWRKKILYVRRNFFFFFFLPRVLHSFLACVEE